MNSRFKFRSWDKKHNCYDDDISPCYFDVDGFVVEQCTGLKDKNGNLIYEGDIVKYENATGVVKFGFYEHFPDNIYGFYIEWEKQCSFRQDFGYWVTGERIEIVGNIHTGIKGE